MKLIWGLYALPCREVFVTKKTEVTSLLTKVFHTLMATVNTDMVRQLIERAAGPYVMFNRVCIMYPNTFTTHGSDQEHLPIRSKQYNIVDVSLRAALSQCSGDRFERTIYYRKLFHMESS